MLTLLHNPWVPQISCKVDVSVAAGGYNRQRAIQALKSGQTDLVCLGRLYLANPDLPNRWREDAPLNRYNRDTFYTQGNEGYVDYPFLSGIPDSTKKFLA